MPSIISLASRDCSVPESWVKDVVRQGPSRVKILRIEKKSAPGKFRYVSRPSSELEILQRWLVHRFFEKLEIHDSAMAFRQGHSILKNAQAHAKSQYFVRVDFSNFFPSIQYRDLAATLIKSEHHSGIFSEYPDFENFVKRICFDANLKLPVGYVSSPAISNSVMFDFDVHISNVISSNHSVLGNCRYTRYADDIVFSTDKKGGCKEFLKILRPIVENWKSPEIFINDDKTILSSKSGGSAIVTGLRVCNDGHITIPRKYKDEIRLLLSLKAKGKLNTDDFSRLTGHLNYVRHVAPAFFSTLCAKHAAIIEDII